MAKGSIEWEYDDENGLLLRIKPLPGFQPGGEACRHMLAARREMMLALRVLIDNAVRHTEEKENREPQGGTRIPVD